MKIRNILSAASAVFFIAIHSVAMAQTSGTVPLYSVPLGLGAGKQGFGSIALGNGQVLIGQTGTFPAAVTPSGGATISAAGVVSLNATIVPQGRVTLVTGVPVMTTSQAGISNIYYTPYAGNIVPIYNGSNVVATAFSELTIALGSNWAANSNWDVFVGTDSGTVRACTGPAWTSDTGRGTGAGTTELVAFNGLRLNANSMTCRYNNTTTFTCAAVRCTYVGSVRTAGSTGIVTYQFGGLAASCTAGNFGVWNAYNRVNVNTFTGDTTDTWNYLPGAAAWRAANASTACRVSAIRGADEDGISAVYYALGGAGTSAVGVVGIGLNSTTAFTGSTGVNVSGSALYSLVASYSGFMGLGYNYVQAIEYNTSTANAVSFVGDFGAVYAQTGLAVSLRQ